MARALGIEFGSSLTLSFRKNQSKLLTIEGVRLGFLAAILFLVFLFELRQHNFVAFDIVTPIYALLFGAFALNAGYLLLYEKLEDYVTLSTASLFAFDAIFITGLIYYTGINQAVFLLLYLVNIVLCGMLYQKRGAFALATFTSVLFSFLLILLPEVRGQTLFFLLGLNNLAFFTVATLSGTLSEQLNIMGEEIKAREKDIAILQDLNKLIVDNIASGLLTIDSKGKILHGNEAAIRLLAAAGAKRVIGESVETIFPRMMKKIEEQVAQFRQDDAGRFEWDYPISEDEELIFDFSVSRMVGGNGGGPRAVSGYILLFRDMTQIKKLERAMRRSEKLAAVGQLAAGVAHEIRNPLASISGSIQMMKDMGVHEKEQTDRLRNIVLREIDRLNVLITEFLEYSRSDQVPKDSVEIDGLVQEIAEICKVNQSLRPDVKQSLKLEAGIPIIGDQSKLKQVFLNLVINAYQAMEKTERPELLMQTTMDEGKVRVIIQDNGIGIEKKNVEKVFEPFHTTKPKGTGLGLATAHKIIENHEGQIHIESEPGKGTRFCVDFYKIATEQVKQTT